MKGSVTMKLSTKKIILRIFLSVIIVFTILTVINPFNIIPILIDLGLIIAFFILRLCWLKCPYCSRILDLGNQNHCKCCGKEISDEK